MQPEPVRREGLSALLWAETVAHTRGPRPSLDLARIAARTVAVADADGLGAVSMQTVAGGLGVSKMALYRYVASKEELLALAVEHAVGDPPDAAPGSHSWNDRTMLWAERLRDVWLAHTWLPGITLGNRLMGPREMAWIEAAATALEGSGLRGGALRATITLLFAHVRSALAREVTGTQYWTSHDDVADRLAEQLRRHAEQFPLLSSAADIPDEDFDAFRYGIEVILAGISAEQTPADQ